jgi:vitamin B12 transporter
MKTLRCLFTFLLWLLMAGPVVCQDSLLLQLPEITVQENRLAIPLSDQTRSVEVVTKAQIEAAPVQSVAELLQYVAGVDIRRRGVDGVQADVSVRGSTFDQVLILVNGVKLADPQTGHHALNLPFRLENIERIEVVKGPSARVFGQNAFAGAINIITQTPKESFIDIQVQGGSFQTGGVSLAASLPKGNYQQYFSVNRDFSQGYRKNTDYNITNLMYQSSVDLNGSELRFFTGFTERAFGANGFYASPANTEQYEEIQTSLAYLEYEHQRKQWTFTPRISWRRNQDEYIFIRSNPSIYRNLHLGNTLSLEVNAANQNAWGQTGLGGELQRVWLVSNNLGTRTRNAAFLFAEHRFRFLQDRIHVTPGVSMNYFSDFGPFFFPGIDLGWDITSGITAFYNAGNTYRIPTFTDLYYEDQANLGNPELEPESAFAQEVGARGQYKGLSWQVSGFRREGTNLIDWTRQSDTLQWQPSNIGEVDMQGVDLSVQAYFPILMPGQNFLQRFSLAYTYIDAETGQIDAPFSRYVLENLEHQFISSLEVRWFKNLHHTFVFRFTDRVTLADYYLMDSRLQWKGENFRIFAEVSNLLDVEYTETNLVPMPGRWFRLGAGYKIQY